MPISAELIELGSHLSNEPCQKCGGAGQLYEPDESSDIDDDDDDLIWDGASSTPCPVCHGRGSSLALFNKSHVPTKYRNAKLVNFEAGTSKLRATLAEVLQYLGGMEWQQPTYRNLLLYGPVGTGKTHLACGLIRAFCELRVTTRFVVVPALFDRLRSSFGDQHHRDYESYEGYEDDDVIRQILKPDVVVLDDIGAAPLSDWDKGQLYKIINKRGNDLHPFVWTTNLEFDAFDKVLESRIASRLLENCRVVHVEGPDYRRRGMKP